MDVDSFHFEIKHTLLLALFYSIKYKEEEGEGFTGGGGNKIMTISDNQQEMRPVFERARAHVRRK